MTFPEGTLPGDVVDLTPDTDTSMHRMMNSWGEPARIPGMRVRAMLSYLGTARKAVLAKRFWNRKREIAQMVEDGMVRSWEYNGETWIKATAFGLALHDGGDIPDLRS